MCYPRKYPLKDFMNIATRMRRLMATSLLFVGLAASLSHAQTPSITIVNGVTCTSAQAVTVTYGAGALQIQTGGCGTTVAQTLPPTITSISVSSGTPGTIVTISGTNLANATVIIGSAIASATATSQQIFATVPNSATVGLGVIEIRTNVSPTATRPFTVIAAPVAAAPTITSVSPSSGQVGAIVTITGTSLSNPTSVTIGGATATVSTSSLTSITTTVPTGAIVAAGNVVVTTTGGTISSPFTVTATVAGDVSIDGIPLPNPSKLAFTIPPARNGLKGAGADINAYAMNPARCNTIPALTRSWQHNIDLANYKSLNAFDFFAMQSGESLSYKFTVGQVDVSGGFVYLDAAASGGDVRPTFMSITTVPCDFDLSKLRPATRDACYQTNISGANILWANLTGDMPPAFCRLVKGQTYYFNLRFQDGRTPADGGPASPEDSCTPGRLCGGVLKVE